MNGLAWEYKLVKGKNSGQDQSVSTELSKWNPERLSLVVLIIQGQRCLVWDDLCLPSAYTDRHWWPNALPEKKIYPSLWMLSATRYHNSIPYTPSGATPEIYNVAETQGAWNHTLQTTWAVITHPIGLSRVIVVLRYQIFKKNFFAGKSMYLGFYVACSHFKNNCCELLHLEWINNKVLIDSTGNCIQYPMISYNGKEP